MEQKQRLSLKDLRERYRKSDATIWRWYTPDKKGFCDFPPPHYLNKHRYWWLDEIEAWETKNVQSYDERANERGEA